MSRGLRRFWLSVALLVLGIAFGAGVYLYEHTWTALTVATLLVVCLAVISGQLYRDASAERTAMPTASIERDDS